MKPEKSFDQEEQIKIILEIEATENNKFNK